MEKIQKFKNVQVGDEVYHLLYGWCEVRIRKETCFYLTEGIKNGKNWDIHTAFNLDGTDSSGKVLCYWKAPIFPEESEDVRPFNLLKFLKDNFKPKNFEYDGHNEIIKCPIDKIYITEVHKNKMQIGALYFEEIPFDAILTLRYQRISPIELNKAFKKLGWIK